MFKQNTLLMVLLACLIVVISSCNSNVGNMPNAVSRSENKSQAISLENAVQQVDINPNSSLKSQAMGTIINSGIDFAFNNTTSLSAIQVRFYSDNLCNSTLPFTIDLDDKGESSNTESFIASKVYQILPGTLSTLCGSNYFGECSNVVSKAKALRAVYYTATGKILYGACSTAAPQAAQSSSNPAPMASNIFSVGGTGATACNASTGSNCLMQQAYTDYLGTDYQDFLIYGGDVNGRKFADCYINFLNGQINNCFTTSSSALQILSFSNVIYNNRYLYSVDSRSSKSIVQVNFNGNYGFYDYQNDTSIDISSLIPWSPNDIWAITIYNNYLYMSVTSNGTYNLVRCTLNPYYGLKSSSQCSLLSLTGISSGQRYDDLYVDGNYLVATSANYKCLYYASINPDGTLSNPNSKCYSGLVNNISNMSVVSNGNGGLYYYLSPQGYESGNAYIYSVTETTAGNPATLSSSLNSPPSNLPNSINASNVGSGHGVKIAAANNYTYYALYTTTSNNIYSCPRNPSTGIISSSCNNTTPWSSWNYIQEIHYLHTPTSTSPLYAFITTRPFGTVNAAVERCQVDPISGLALANSCSYLYGSNASSNGGTTLGQGQNGVVYNGYFYTANGDGVLWKIPVNDSSNVPESASVQPNGIGAGIGGLIIYNGILYAANDFAKNDVYSVLGEALVNNSFPVSTSSLSAYLDSAPPSAAQLNYMTAAQTITNPTTNNYIYIATTNPTTNGNANTMAACQINSTTGKITASTCNQIPLPNNESTSRLGAISTYNDKLYISYVETTSNKQKLYVCNTNSTNATLNSCISITEKTTAFTQIPFSNITVNQGYLYLVDNSNSIIWRCVLNSNSNIAPNSCVNFFTNSQSITNPANNANNITFSQAY